MPSHQSPDPSHFLVGVVGAGTMGSGIAQVLVQNGFEVLLQDVEASALSRALDKIRWGLSKSGKEDLIRNCRPVSDFKALAKAQFVIEAAIEDLQAKKRIFKSLGEIVSSDAVLATNTSSISVSAIAQASLQSERVVGMHFFNPAPLMRLVEVVRAEKSSREAVEKTVELAKKLGKTPIVVKDSPGFIANRVTRPFYLAAMRLLEQGQAGVEEIDSRLKEKGFRMGPFELMDLIGLDVNLSISEVVYDSLGRPPRLKPCLIQKKMVEEGSLGRKTGEGFYLYKDSKPAGVNPRLREWLKEAAVLEKPGERIFESILKEVIEEAKTAEEEGVASSQDIDLTMKLGMNWPRGPFEYEKEGFAIR